MRHGSLISKRAIRVLGVAESFKLTHPKSILTGVVMRSDFIIDGVVNSYATVGGLDVTDSIIGMFKGLNRPDVHAVMVDGCIISFYNIVDIDRLHSELKVPVMCLAFSRSRGNPRAAIVKLFKDYEERLSILDRIGEPVMVNTKYGPVWVRYRGLSYGEVKVLISKFQRDGRRPEPLRVSQLISASMFRSMYGD
ncbi:MAG: DUF99 family protein [Caldivirga sp.]|jgi:hypothetical protein|nr:DUF99 family protein [Caldivirga sp.]